MSGPQVSTSPTTPRSLEINISGTCGIVVSVPERIAAALVKEGRVRYRGKQIWTAPGVNYEDLVARVAIIRAAPIEHECPLCGLAHLSPAARA